MYVPVDPCPIAPSNPTGSPDPSPRRSPIHTCIGEYIHTLVNTYIHTYIHTYGHSNEPYLLNMQWEEHIQKQYLVAPDDSLLLSLDVCTYVDKP